MVIVNLDKSIIGGDVGGSLTEEKMGREELGIIRDNIAGFSEAYEEKQTYEADSGVGRWYDDGVDGCYFVVLRVAKS